MTALFLASIAVTLCVGGWLGVRAQTVEDDLARFLVSIPPHEWQHLDD